MSLTIYQTDYEDIMGIKKSFCIEYNFRDLSLDMSDDMH